MFSSGRSSVTLEEVLEKTSELEIAVRYLGIDEIPCVINSPLREDKHPSFGLYLSLKDRVRYTDMATGERGGIFDLLSQMWRVSYQEVLDKVYADAVSNKYPKLRNYTKAVRIIKEKIPTKIDIKIREWKDYDEEYWKSYGISIPWLKYADVYPISHKFLTKEGVTYTFGADKYAYAFIERKEGNISIKIYQPFNKEGFKWCTSTDRSVISLWTKVPEEGDRICICSSLKDALCLWANTGIPALATQGEGYTMSDTAIGQLRKRFKNVYILFDNDAPGIADGEKLSNLTGFTNIVLPHFNEGKDVSDLYKFLQNPNKFREIILSLFKNS